MRTDLYRKPAYLIARSKDDILGVTSYEDLQSKLELICAMIKHPVTLYCFYDYELDKSGKRKMVRIDSNIASVTLHWCCETFRICAGYEYCEASDTDHACLFYDEEKPIDVVDLVAFKKLIDEKIAKMQTVHPKPIYYNEVAPVPNFVCTENICYIDYFCSIMGFHELIFPIIICGRVLGAIFCGQVSREEDCDEIGLNVREAFLEARSDLFQHYKWDKANSGKPIGYNEEALRRHLREGYDRYKMPLLQYPTEGPNTLQDLQDGKWINVRQPYILPKGKFGKLIKKVNKEIGGVCSALENTLQERRKGYIVRLIQSTTEEFHQKVSGVLQKMGKEIDTRDKSNISGYWEQVQQLLKPLVDALPIRDFQIYGASNVAMGVGNYPKDTWLSCVALLYNQPYEDINSEDVATRSLLGFKVKATDADSSAFLLSSHAIAGYDSEKITPELTERVFQSPDSEDPRPAYGFEAQKGDEGKENLLDKEQVNVFFIPVRDGLSHSSAIVWALLGRQDIYDVPEMDILYAKYIADEIRANLIQLATLIFYVNWYLLDSVLQANTEMVLRFFRHEIDHVLLGFGALNKNYIQNDRFGKLPDEKRKDVREDFASTEKMLRYIEKNMEILTKPAHQIKTDRDGFLIFKELLIKWEIMYEDELQDKRLKIWLPTPSLRDPLRPMVIGDTRLTEQIIYNIVSNAIKYSYWGSNIYIDCKMPHKNSGYQVLTVRDYGASMPLGERPYELYFRDNDQKLNIEGSGIGLYVVKKICEILGYKVKHDCKKISDYNVPLIDKYLNREFRLYPKDKKLTEALRAAKKQIAQEFGPEKMREIVRARNSGPGLNERQLIDQIAVPTHEVMIEVHIPVPSEDDYEAYFYLIKQRYKNN